MWKLFARVSFAPTLAEPERIFCILVPLLWYIGPKCMIFEGGQVLVLSCNKMLTLDEGSTSVVSHGVIYKNKGFLIV
jgi:hypothetical protein